jgi:hypothetical protein
MAGPAVMRFDDLNVPDLTDGVAPARGWDRAVHGRWRVPKTLAARCPGGDRHHACAQYAVLSGSGSGCEMDLIADAIGAVAAEEVSRDEAQRLQVRKTDRRGSVR